MTRWDTERLLHDCDLRALAQYLGIKTKRSGSTTFIECLSGLHHETDINHMVCDHDGCYCFSCHCSYDGFSEHNDAISTVRQFRRVYGGDDSFDAACETIAEFLGGRERYVLSPEKEQRRKKLLPFSSEELASAGFSKDAFVRKTLQQLYEADEVFVKSIVLSKAEETIRKLKIISRSENTALSDEATKRLNEANSFYEKVKKSR